jgi:hypothetical protein
MILMRAREDGINPPIMGLIQILLITIMTIIKTMSVITLVMVTIDMTTLMVLINFIIHPKINHKTLIPERQSLSGQGSSLQKPPRLGGFCYTNISLLSISVPHEFLIGQGFFKFYAVAGGVRSPPQAAGN